MRQAVFVCVAVMAVLQCDDPGPTSTSAPSPVVATEAWHVTVPQSLSYADIGLHRHENGSISCSGSWYYDFYGSDITCTIMSGSVTKDTSHLVLQCSGNASYPPDSSGYTESSGFQLTMSGRFMDGACAGTWEISFTDQEWDEWAPGPGDFDGARLEGDGVTE
jgi:hypothetical protein